MLDSLTSASLFALSDLAQGLFLAAEASTWESWGHWLYNVLLVVLGLGFVIFVHELGHFLAAKTFGVKCEKFYVGFDVPIKIGPIRLPSKLAHFQWGETEYGIGVIPLGGYVKMLGQDDDPRKLKEEAERIRTQDPNAVGQDTARPALDPRSYPAKPVFARMIIISAGVIMNLIFGVLMAAVAFKIGVPYDPAIIGEVIPGDPAWKAGIQPGDKIVHVATVTDEQLSFNDMRQKVALAGIRDPNAPVSLTYERDGSKTDLSVMGTTVHSAADSKIKLLTLGIRAASTTQLSKTHAFDRHRRNEGDKPGDLKPSDVIVGVNGVPLPSVPFSDLPMGYHLERVLHPRLNESVTLQVERADGDKKKKVDVELPPVPLKTLGVSFGIESVSAVVDPSPASKAGVQLGDKPIRFNGKPIEDGLTLPFVVAGFAGKEVTLDLQRSDETLSLSWTVPVEFQLVNTISMFSPSGMELPGSGLVYKVADTVQGQAVDTASSATGLQAGDRIKQIQFVPRTDAQKKYYKDVIDSKSLLEKIPVDSAHNVQFFFEMLQILPERLPVVVDYERKGKIESTELSVQIDSVLHWPDRGLSLQPLKKTYQADGWIPALKLGVFEIWRRLGDVTEFLTLLVQGKAFNAIGGPGTIAVQATDAASQGISPLLMFLTLLSANLAIVNFLPIPALDGGHMVFLATEAVLGRPVDEELQMKLTLGGVVGLLCLMAWAIFNDYIHLSRFFGG